MRLPSSRTASVALSLLLIESTLAREYRPCSLLGPDVPIPKKVSGTFAFKDAVVSIQKAIADAVSSGQTSYGTLNASATSFSLDIFSLHEEDGLFTYHYDAPGLANSTDGVKKIDSNSIYRLGSISKLLTAYTFLASVGDLSFNEPITKYIPELAAYAAQHAPSDDAIDFMDWDSITIGALASHLGGIPSAAAGSASTDTLFEGAIPPGVPIPDFSPVPANISDADCPNFYGIPCTRAAEIESINFGHPTVAPFHGPVYSNVGYVLLQLALEKMTNASLPSLFTDKVTTPLNLSNTYFANAPLNQGVVPLNDAAALYSLNLTYGGSSGGYYSSTADMRTIGRAILSSALLPAPLTRRWMKPHTFTANAAMLVGAPWEIYKAPLTERNVWMYTKGGDVGAYSTNFVLLPDYGIGFTVLAAGGEDPHQVQTIVSDIVAEIGVPAFQKAAKEEAESVYAGTYHGIGSGTAANENDVLVLAVDSNSGLLVSSWSINGTDVVSAYRAEGLQVRLNPSGLVSNKGTKEGWRVLLTEEPVVDGAFVGECVDWFGVGATVLGGVGLDEFVISLSGDRTKAVGVEARGWRVGYERG